MEVIASESFAIEIIFECYLVIAAISFNNEIPSFTAEAGFFCLCTFKTQGVCLCIPNGKLPNRIFAMTNAEDISVAFKVTAFHVVIAGTAVKRIFAFMSIKRIITGTTIEGVITLIAFQEIIAFTAVERVITAIAMQGIITGVAIKRIIAFIAPDVIIATLAVNDVIRYPAAQSFIIFRAAKGEGLFEHIFTTPCGVIKLEVILAESFAVKIIYERYLIIAAVGLDD